MIITVAPYVYRYLLLNWIDLIPSDVSDYFHSGPKDQRFPLSRGFLPDSEPRPFLSWDWSWIDENRREFRKRNRSVCVHSPASSTATIRQGEEGGPQQGLDTKEIAENIFLRYCDFITYHAHVFYLIFSGPVVKKPFEIEWHFVLPQKKPLLFGFDEWQAE